MGSTAGSLPDVCLVDFDASGFDPSLFASYAVPRPESILRSVHKRQAKFFFGRYCARLALAELGALTGEIPIGKFREPVWPHGIIGSITDTGSLAAAVALHQGRYSGIGIDIEYSRNAHERSTLRSVVVNAEEFTYLESMAAFMPIDLLLTIVFSAKESSFKRVFGTVHRYFDFDAVMVVDLSL